MATPEFIRNSQRRIQRAVPNPMDKTTIISIYPKTIDEIKHTLTPSRFVVPPGSYDKPSIAIFGPSSWFLEIDSERPITEMVVSSIQIADSIIVDYSNGLLACNMADCMPGLFFLPGARTLDDIKKNERSRLDAALAKQRNWYLELVKMADIMWARTNGNPLSIGDLMRLAAQELGLKDKPWLRDFTTLELKNCPACGTLRNELFPVCVHCKTIVDQKKYDLLNLKAAV